jgi:putative transposon-encoded protein
MWYYNQNQIQRLKIKKNEFIKKKTLAKNIEEHIERVINPFEP